MLAGVACACLAANMNGRYSVSSVDKQDVPFNDDYASKGYEFFDVWDVGKNSDIEDASFIFAVDLILIRRAADDPTTTLR